MPLSFQTPFIQFTTFAASVPLDNHKYHLKTYANSFTGDDAFSTVCRLTSCSRDEAVCLIGHYIQGGLVRACGKSSEGAADDGKGKGKGVYVISGKGQRIVADVKAGKVEEAGDAGELLYLERTSTGKLNIGLITFQNLFKRLAGPQPNIWTNEKSKEQKEGSMPAHEELSKSQSSSFANVADLIGPEAMLVKDRIHHLKTYTNTFHGSEVVDWVFTNTSVMSREEAVMIASQFVTMGWISCIDEVDAKTIRDSGALYQFTVAGGRMANWTEKDIAAVSKKGTGLEAGKMLFGMKKNTDEPKISAENLEKFDTFLRKSSEMLSAREGESGGFELDPSSTVTALVDKFNTGVRAGVNAASWKRHRASTFASSPWGTPRTSVGSNTAPRVQSFSSAVEGDRPGSPGRSQRASVAERPSGTSSPARDIMPWEAAKESNATKLSIILAHPDLRESFRSFLASMFCEENLWFWTDAEIFRSKFGAPADLVQSIIGVSETQFRSSTVSSSGTSTATSTTAVPSPPMDSTPLTQQDSADGPRSSRTSTVETPADPLLIPHALAIYQKYIPANSPSEINIGSNLKNQISAIVEKARPLFNLVDPECFCHEGTIDAQGLLRPGVRADAFPRSMEGFEPSMYESVEAHIFRLMAGDSVPKFVKTEQYFSLMARLWREGAFIVKSEGSRKQSSLQKWGGTSSTPADDEDSPDVGAITSPLLSRHASGDTPLPSSHGSTYVLEADSVTNSRGMVSFTSKALARGPETPTPSCTGGEQKAVAAEGR
ncbi:hypothetical protein HK104_000332 [Borealophlyctis nickersoniae]|nr:hypothetical protein HK104_000332 [Borealophlyctis nickersoniae]